jgi:hypothetical protein
MEDQITECPGPDSVVQSAMKKIRFVMMVLRQQGEQQLFLRLRSARKDLESAMEHSKEVHATESELTDIKRRAGIVEFADTGSFDGYGSGGQPDPEGVPLWQRLQSIAKSAQGVGRIDQHQIEEVFRAAEVLKKLDR